MTSHVFYEVTTMSLRERLFYFISHITLGLNKCIKSLLATNKSLSKTAIEFLQAVSIFRLMPKI